MINDLRYALRMLRQNPGFSAIAILMLALGIGANAAIFTVVNAALIRPLPYPAANRLVTIFDDFTKPGLLGFSPTIPEYIDLKEQNRVFEATAFLDHRDMQISGGDRPERVFCARVSPGFFSLLGVQAARGRTLLPEESQAGRTNVAVLTHD